MTADWVCFDAERAAVPLVAFDDVCFDANYRVDLAAVGNLARRTSEHSVASHRRTSEHGHSTEGGDEEEDFLVPTLTRDERSRLESLWYYTREVRDDGLLLDTLQTIVNMVQAYFKWDCVIVGLVEKDVYTRLVTAGCPLAVLPRRESTCAHTVLHEPHTVFELSDMEADRRFKHSPHVVAGLRAYSGTQLCLRTIDGKDEVSIGSLCIAHYEARPRMDDRDRDFLLDAARLLSDRMTQRARAYRQSARTERLDRLRALEALAPEKMSEAIVTLLEEVHPGGHIVVTTSCVAENNSLNLNKTIDIDDFHLSIYTDDAAIERFVLGQHNDIDAAVTYRAIAVNSPPGSSTWFAVETRDPRIVFDDLDVWFVARCCELLEAAEQKTALERALATKARFVRSMSHQLRTPLHSIMSYAQLMREDAELDRQRERSGVSDDLLLKIDLCGGDLLEKINGLLEV